MSDLISGKEALSRVSECIVQYKCDNDPVSERWTTITDNFWSQYNLGVFLDVDTTWKFRLKPKTIMLNGVEIPAPFEPKDGDIYYFLNSSNLKGYGFNKFSNNGDDECLAFYGAWRTKEEIKQVVEALRSVFK